MFLCKELSHNCVNAKLLMDQRHVLSSIWEKFDVLLTFLGCAFHYNKRVHVIFSVLKLLHWVKMWLMASRTARFKAPHFPQLLPIVMRDLKPKIPYVKSLNCLVICAVKQFAMLSNVYNQEGSCTALSMPVSVLVICVCSCSISSEWQKS